MLPYPFIAQCCPEATKRKTEFLNMQNKIKKSSNLTKVFSTPSYTHTYFFKCTVHVILNKITKANNSYCLLLTPCSPVTICQNRMSHIQMDYSLIFSNILIGCNYFKKKHALNMGHKKNFPLPEGNTMQ